MIEIGYHCDCVGAASGRSADDAGEQACVACVEQGESGLHSFQPLSFGVRFFIRSRSLITELSWTSPVPPIFAYVNKSLKGKWAALACYETGWFVNLEESAKDGIVDELLGQCSAVFGEVAKSHPRTRVEEAPPKMALNYLFTGLLEFATNEQGSKSAVKALKEGGKETLDRVVQRMCEPAKGYAALSPFSLPY
ncbi:hypothetical protein B0H13DRAFT_2368298 [Mycena leptocephala]|nr:hypothetical protein B0H13DRAFT_2368298 [Mycena leptocephala]